MDKKIRIYSTPSCSYCRMAKDFFEDNNISYEDVDVASDEEAREELVKKTGKMEVPVIDIDGELMIGFDEEKLRELTGVQS